ncbi:MAG: ABC transporter substrate-binding protein [Candidatus Heimdallarchaeaceae archaeon]
MRKRKIVFFSIALCFTFLTSSIPQQANEDPLPLFYIALLSPITCTQRNQWSFLMEEELPKIGIGIARHEATGWGNIMPRVWSYPVGEEGYYDHIPTYEEGGYDILFIGWNWLLDWDPTWCFDSASIVPAGDNMYQYNNPEFDKKLEEYITELDENARIAKGEELQAILYDDLPAITILYPREIYALNKSTSGIDTLLLSDSAHRAENWRNSLRNNITYAQPAELDEYNIFVQESYYDALWMSCVYYGLFERSQNKHLMEPVIAKNYSVSEDKLTITVDINPNAYFSNGEPVTAYDVDYTYKLYMTPAVDSIIYEYLTTYFENNESIKALDEDTIQFTFKKKYAFSLSLLSYGIINKNLVQNYIDSNGYNLNVLDQALVTSCGPYMLNVSDYNITSSTVLLHSNPYWNLTDDDLLDSLIFTYIPSKSIAIDALKRGSVDIVDAKYAFHISDFEGIDVNMVITKLTSTQEMAINMRHPIIGTGELTPLGTAEAARYIRKAISYAVPREIIVEEILEGLGAQGVSPMPEGCIGFDASLEPYIYDIYLARQFMELAGYNLEYNTTMSSENTDNISSTSYDIGSTLSVLLICIISVSIINKRKERKGI